MFAWSGLEFYQPEDGYLCYVDFGTLAKNFKEQEINEENVYPYTWDIEHFISDIGLKVQMVIMLKILGLGKIIQTFLICIQRN